jgi:hypothetical protein
MLTRRQRHLGLGGRQTRIECLLVRDALEKPVHAGTPPIPEGRLFGVVLNGSEQKVGSRWRDLNPRPIPYEGIALPV